MPIIILPSGGNDTAALQAADTQAQQAGTYLSLGPGTFNVVPGLVAHVPWIGTSKYLTSIKAINSTWSFGTPLIALTSNAILALITIDTSLAIYGSYNYPTINASGAINWGIKHCNFTGIKSPAISIYAGNVSNFKISDNDFRQKIKKIFKQYRTRNTKKTMKDICFPTKFTYQLPQLFVSQFINPETPYKSLLVYHKIGAGKTCAGIKICEEWKEKKNGNLTCW